MQSKKFWYKHVYLYLEYNANKENFNVKNYFEIKKYIFEIFYSIFIHLFFVKIIFCTKKYALMLKDLWKKIAL